MSFQSYPLSALILLCIVVNASSTEAKQLYRWTDDQGEVHYSDIIPPTESKYGRSRLNTKGLTIEKVEAAKTKQQLEQEKRLSTLRAQKQKVIAEQLAYDRVLLRTFRNTDEIKMTLAGKLQTIRLLNRLAQDNIKRLNEQLLLQQKRAANFEKNGMKVPYKLLQEIKTTHKQIEENKNKIRSHNKEKIRLKHTFKKDELRFIALQKQFNSESKGAIAPFQKAIVSVINCKDESSCNSAWLRARRYVNQHATTPLQIDTETILMTKKPTLDHELSLTVTRISGSKKQDTQLFLDAECKPSNLGQELCNSQKVKDILAGFPAFIKPSR
jgi:hypothetical protein